MVDINDEIKDYITNMASAFVTNDDIIANMREADKKKDAEMAEMSAQIRQLTAAVAKLASWASKTQRTTTPTRTVVAVVESSNR